jgi:hypothetical protein
MRVRTEEDILSRFKNEGAIIDKPSTTWMIAKKINLYPV